MTTVNGESESNQHEEVLELKKQQFTYSEILSITNNFERILGKGGFGTVYHGYHNDSQVAVKMLSRSSAQGYKQFRAEVVHYFTYKIRIYLKLHWFHCILKLTNPL